MLLITMMLLALNLSANDNINRGCEESLELTKAQSELKRYEKRAEYWVKIKDHRYFQQLLSDMSKNPEITASDIEKFIALYTSFIFSDPDSYGENHPMLANLLAKGVSFEQLPFSLNYSDDEKVSDFFNHVVLRLVKEGRVDHFYDFLNRLRMNNQRHVILKTSSLDSLGWISLAHDPRFQELVTSNHFNNLGLSFYNDYDPERLSQFSQSDFYPLINALYLNHYEYHFSKINLSVLPNLKVLYMTNFTFDSPESLSSLLNLAPQLKALFITDPAWVHPKALSHFLQSALPTKLEILSIEADNKIDDQFVAELVQTKMFNNLRELSLSQSNLNQTGFTDNGLRILGQALGNSKLETLELVGTRFSAKALREFFDQAHPGQLRKINLRHMRSLSSIEELRYVFESPGLRELSEIHLFDFSDYSWSQKSKLPEAKEMEQLLETHPRKKQIRYNKSIYSILEH
jgi:hypothetical protein